MQLTLLSAAASLVAAVSASKSAVDLNKACDHSKPNARVINRCDYPVYLWSVWKGVGCPTDGMVTLKKGEVYSENFQYPDGGDQGVSIKISKTTQCKGNDIVQLEYFMEKRNGKEQWHDNYLDVSYVDCLDGNCPTKQEGFYLQSGNQTGVAKASAQNTRCPVLACSDAASCAKMAYILPDDVQTKTCDLDSNLDFYMCGSQPPSGDEKYGSAPASSPKNEYPAAKPSSTVKPVTNVEYKANAAAVTNPPEIKETVKGPRTKTKVVVVTAYEYVNAKRHEHAHARRHQPFHA